jgi:hypothetical protein
MKRKDGAPMTDYVCETCSEEARFVFVSLDTVVSAACEAHRKPVVQRLVEQTFEPARLASGVKRADLAVVPTYVVCTREIGGSPPSAV